MSKCFCFTLRKTSLLQPFVYFFSMCNFSVYQYFLHGRLIPVIDQWASWNDFSLRILSSSPESWWPLFSHQGLFHATTGLSFVGNTVVWFGAAVAYTLILHTSAINKSDQHSRIHLHDRKLAYSLSVFRWRKLELRRLWLWCYIEAALVSPVLQAAPLDPHTWKKLD